MADIRYSRRYGIESGGSILSRQIFTMNRNAKVRAQVRTACVQVQVQVRTERVKLVRTQIRTRWRPQRT